MRNEWKVCIRWGITALLFFLVTRYWSSIEGFLFALKSAAGPLLFGCIAAYIVNIPMAFYERVYLRIGFLKRCQKLKRPLCMILAIVSVLAVLWLVLKMIIPELVACVQLLIQGLYNAVGYVITWAEENLPVQEWFGNRTLEVPDIPDIQDLIRKIGSFLMNGVGTAFNTVATVIGTVFSSVLTLFVGVVFAVYLLTGKERICGQFRTLIRHCTGERFQRRLYSVLDTLNTCFHSFIVGQVTEAVILGALCMVGMWILRLPYAAMIGCLIGVTALIPVAGAYIGAVVGAVMILTVSPMKSLVFVIYLLILQQIEGNLIYPKVVGSSIGLPGIWVLAAITIGGGVMGVTGMLLGVPIAASVYVLLRKSIAEKAAAEKLKEESMPETEETK